MSPPGPRIAMAVLRKDLLLDLRTRERLGHMAVFAALVVVLLGLTLPTSRAARSDWIPALLWIVFLFTSLLGLSRSFQAVTVEGAVAILIQAPCEQIVQRHDVVTGPLRIGAGTGVGDPARIG